MSTQYLILIDKDDGGWLQSVSSGHCLHKLAGWTVWLPFSFTFKWPCSNLIGSLNLGQIFSKLVQFRVKHGFYRNPLSFTVCYNVKPREIVCIPALVVYPGQWDPWMTSCLCIILLYFFLLIILSSLLFQALAATKLRNNI